MGDERCQFSPLIETDPEYVREHWEDEFKRGDALLTDKQRKFLLGLVEYDGENSRQQRYQMRNRIRGRLINGIRDLSLLDRLDGSSREKIHKESELYLRSGVTDLLRFLYTSTKDRNLIEQIVETAIYIAEDNNPELGESTATPSSVSVEINAEYPPDIDAVYDRYQEQGLLFLQPEEVGLLIEHFRLDPDDLAQHYKEMADSFDDESLTEKYPHSEEVLEENEE